MMNFVAGTIETRMQLTMLAKADPLYLLAAEVPLLGRLRALPAHADAATLASGMAPARTPALSFRGPMLRHPSRAGSQAVAREAAAAQPHAGTKNVSHVGRTSKSAWNDARGLAACCRAVATIPATYRQGRACAAGLRRVPLMSLRDCNAAPAAEPDPRASILGRGATAGSYRQRWHLSLHPNLCQN